MARSPEEYDATPTLLVSDLRAERRVVRFGVPSLWLGFDPEI
jgi:hypothetical protein